MNSQASMFGTSDIGHIFNVSEVGGLPWETPDVYRERSPLTYAKNVTTPLLIIHSEDDLRCPIEQGEQLFVALKKQGKETVFVRFPDENHELSRSGTPRHRLERFRIILDWFTPRLGAEGRWGLRAPGSRHRGAARNRAARRRWPWREAGADVALNYLDDRAAAERVAAEIRGLGRRALTLPGDVSKAAEVTALVEGVTREWGVPDVLVNNAGVFPRSPFLRAGRARVGSRAGREPQGRLPLRPGGGARPGGGRAGRQHHQSRLAGRARRAAGRPLHGQQGRGGGDDPRHGAGAGPHGIRVNAVAPGLTDTAQPRYEHSEATMAELSRSGAAGPDGATRRHRGRHRVSGRGRGPARSRGDHPRQWGSYMA